MLYGFSEHDILEERDEHQALRKTTEKAIELAMMGMQEKAREILDMLRGKGTVPGERYDTMQEIIYAASGLRGPIEEGRLEEEGLDEEQHVAMDRRAVDQLSDLPEDTDFDNVTEEAYAKLTQFKDCMERSEYVDATSGYDAMRMSSALVGLIHMAHSLGHDNDVETLMTRIAKRIHSNQQPEYLGFLRVVWQRYLLPGWLRKQLDLSPEKLSSYADFVLATAKRRLEDGPLRPEALYADKSIHGLLEILEHNTKTDPRYEDEDEDQNSVPPEQRQVLRPAATDEEISAAEERIGRLLPDDMKDFLRISNGCGRIRSGAWLFRVPLPPLDQIYLEDEGYMADYTFTLLPDADLGGVEVDWPGITGGGIAMYENDGQGTDYVWILTEELVAEAKARLDEAYVAATGEQKGKITRAIEQLYGSVRAFDEMRTCVYRQGWGSPSGQICCPSFRAFLCRVVYESQYVEERSPLGIRQEDLF